VTVCPWMRFRRTMRRQGCVLRRNLPIRFSLRATPSENRRYMRRADSNRLA